MRRKMEGCCTISISKKQSCLFPILLRLSTKGEGFGGLPGARKEGLMRLGLL